MSEAYSVLGLSADSDDETIRRRYLELVRQYPPERHAEKFSAIRAAYDSLRDINTRLRHRLFEAGKNESVDKLIEEVQCRSQRRRMSASSAVNCSAT